MASSYPTGVDSFTTHQDDVNELIRAADINKIQDAVRAIETELGLNPHGASADVAARLATLLSAATAASTYVPLTGSATIAGQKDFTTLPTFNGTPLGGALNERGTWATSTAYAVADVVNDTTNGQRYVCKAAHTSTTFSADLSGGKWTTTGTSKNYVDTAVAGTAQRLVQTATKTANYTAVIKDLVPVDSTGGSVVITLPTGAAVGDAVGVRRADSSANTVTVTAGGSDTIASGTSTVTSTTITLQDSVQVFVYNGSGQWTVAGGHRSLAALDARYLQQTTRGATNGVASLDGSTLVPTAQLATGTADNSKVLQGDRTWATAVKLAQSGQTPAQEPVPAGTSANVGTLAYAARADHVHPIASVYSLAGVGDYLETGQSTGSFIMTEAREVCVPIVIPYAMTIDQIGVALSGNGSTGALIRLGARAFNPSAPGVPGSVLVDAGTVDATSGSSSNKAVTLGSALAVPAGILWLSATCQGGATTRPATMQNSYLPVRATGTQLANGRYYVGPYQDGVTGALGTFTVVGRALDNTAPWMYVRRAS